MCVCDTHTHTRGWEERQRQTHTHTHTHTHTRGGGRQREKEREEDSLRVILLSFMGEEKDISEIPLCLFARIGSLEPLAAREAINTGSCLFQFLW